MPEIAVTTVNNELSGTTGGTPAGNHAAWLKQFESAQWQQRLRYQPAGERQHAGQLLAESDARKPIAKAASAPLPDNRSAKDKNAQAPVAKNTAGEGGVHFTPAPTSSSHAVMRSAPVAVAPLQDRAIALAIDQRHSAAQLPRRFVHIPWQAQHAHAMLDAEGVKLWLRDARYEGSNGQRLLQTLRGHFARLGLRLAQFTLNGTTVLKADHFE